VNSLPRVRMNWRRQLAAAGSLAAAAGAGTWALAAVVPGALAVTPNDRVVAAAPAPGPVSPFGMASRVPATAPDAAPATAQATVGAFVQYCGGCHGPEGRGLPGLGVDLRGSAFVRSLDDAALGAFLRAGRAPGDAGNRTGRPMPAFAWLPEETLAEIVGALRAPP